MKGIVMNKDLAYFQRIIESKGYKFSTKRQIVLETLMESNIHLNAEEIYKKVKKYKISISTVYKSLKMLSELGIAKEINVNDISYYEMKIFSKKPLHIHFKCSECNRIIDIDNRNLDLKYLKLNKEVEEQNDLIVYDANIMFIGLCSKCKEQGKYQNQQNLQDKKNKHDLKIMDRV
jgi:Fe2+ or Zn2+ uptake regulation protein